SAAVRDVQIPKRLSSAIDCVRDIFITPHPLVTPPPELNCRPCATGEGNNGNANQTIEATPTDSLLVPKKQPVLPVARLQRPEDNRDRELTGLLAGFPRRDYALELPNLGHFPCRNVLCAK